MTTTTNPSLAVDNDAERRSLAWSNALTALAELDAIHDTHRLDLEAENARLRAALTEAEKNAAAWEYTANMLGSDQVDNMQAEIGDLRHNLAAEQRARAILAKQFDEECARLPRLRQEQTAEIERLKAELMETSGALGRIEGTLGLVGRGPFDEAIARVAELAKLKKEQTARIADLEAEVTKLKHEVALRAYLADKGLSPSALDANPPAPAAPAVPVRDDDEAEIVAAAGAAADADFAAWTPAPAAPAVPVVEVGSRWMNQSGHVARVIRADITDVFVCYEPWGNEHCFPMHLFRRAFVRLPDEPTGGGET